MYQAIPVLRTKPVDILNEPRNTNQNIIADEQLNAMKYRCCTR